MGEDAAVRAMRDGAQDYLIKSSLKRLVPAVQRALNEHQLRQDRLRLEKHVQQLQKFEESVGSREGSPTILTI